MAMADPRAPRPESGFLNTTTLAKMMTTRLMVLPTACVTGATSDRARKATSLYLMIKTKVVLVVVVLLGGRRMRIILVDRVVRGCE